MKIKLIATVLLIGLLASCKKDDNLVYNMPDTKGETVQPLPIDIWIRDTLNIPYNIAVKYKWDALELDIYKTLVPPQESLIVPSLQSIKEVWMDTYIAEAGDVFFKKMSPKQLILVGSADYQSDGSTILGTAEAGRKIVLFNINGLNLSNADGSFTKLLHVIEHEFGHILHQTKPYPADFKTITPSYTSSWGSYTISQANNMGFITAYAMAAPDEDFAEMVSTMLTTPRKDYDAMIDKIPASSARTALRKKEDIIVSYYRDNYDIDFYALQTRTVAAIADVMAKH